MRKKHPEKSKNDEIWITTSSGENAVDFQKSAQITWWSIMQGISVATLVAKLPNIGTTILHEQKWYLILFVIATFMIIVNTWISLAWAILTFRWRLNMVHTALMLVHGTVTQLICVYIEDPQYWCLAVAALTVSTVIIFVYNNHQKVFLGKDLGAAEKNARFHISLFAGYTLLCLVASFSISQYPTPMLHIVWGFVFLLAVGSSLKVQSDNMSFDRKYRNIP